MGKRFEKILGCLVAAAILALPALDNISEVSPGEEGLISSCGLINEHPGIMRFHVVANSDSEEDQNLKIAVRNYVLSKVQNEITQEISEAGRNGETDQAGVMRSYIQNNLPQIEAWAQEVIDINNADYGATASIGIRHIPAKEYGDLFFPEGNYEALTVSLGEGRGQNWWCVVFPPLCFVDSEDSTYAEELGVDENQKLILKFKTEELLKDSSSESEAAHWGSCRKCGLLIGRTLENAIYFRDGQ